MSAPKNELVANAGLYSFMAIAAQLITLASGLLTRHFLGPLQMGIWSTLQIILNYSSYSTLGAAESFNREIPYYRGKGDHEKASEIRNLFWSFSTVTSLIIAAAVIFYAVFFHASMRQELVVGLVLTAALVLIQRASNLSVLYLYSHKRFDLAGKQSVLSAVVNGVLVALLSYRFQLYGFFAAMGLSFVFTIVFIRIHENVAYRWQWDWTKISAMIAYGLPLMMVGLVNTLFLTIDKIMIAKMIGFDALGLYSIGLLAYGYLGNIPNSVGIVLMPSLHEKFGQTQSVEVIKNFLLKSCDVFSTLMPLFIAAGWFWIGDLVRAFLPAYAAGIWPAKILLLSAYFLALIHPFGYYLAVVRKQSLLLPIVGLACAAAAGFNFAAIRMGYGILGVAAATTLVMLFKFLATYSVAANSLFTFPRALLLAARYILRFAWMTAVILMLDAWVLPSTRSLAAPAAKSVVFLLLQLPFLHQLNRKTGIFNTLWRRFVLRAEPNAA